MKRKLLVLLMAAAILATIMPMNAMTVAMGEEEPEVMIEPPAEELTEAPEASAETPEEELEKEPAEAPEEPGELPDEQLDPAADEETDAALGEEPAAEPAEEPTEETAEEPATEPEVPFAATVRIKLENEGDIYFGDRVTLRAEVEANADYTVVWEYLDEEPEEPVWVALEEGETYEFDVNEANAVLAYRAVVNGVVASDAFVLPTVTERPAETEPSEGEEPAEEAAPSEGEEPAEEVPSDEVEEPVEVQKAELNPERYITIRAEWEGDLHYGDEVTLVADLFGYENAVYTVQWQTSANNTDWTDVPGATKTSYTMTVTDESYAAFWRVIATVTEVMSAE